MSLEFNAAIFTSPGTDLAVESVSIPEEIRDHEVLVKLAASGVCHSDYHVINGDWDTPAPLVLGHEGAGIVVETGKAVTRVNRDDHVVLSWTPSCGHCEFCAKGRPVLCQFAHDTAYQHLAYDGRTRLRLRGQEIYSFIGVGSFGEYALVHEDAAIKIRNDAPLAQASLVGCAVTTGIGAVVNTAQMNVGDTALVVGCGGVGLNVIQGARLAGARQVIVADVSATKLDLAKEFGATDVVNSRDQDLVEAVTALTHGRGVDFSFEAIGLAATIEQAHACTVRGGTTVIVGQVADDVKIAIDPFVMSDQEKRIIGSNYGSCITSIDFAKVIDLYMTGQVDLDGLITKRIALDEINDAFELMERGEGIRTVIEY